MVRAREGRAERTPNETEILFFSLLVLQAAFVLVQDLKSWAIDVLRYKPVYEPQGASGLPAAWKYSPKVPVPPVFSVLNDSCDRE